MEKHRPKTLDEVVGQRHIIGSLKTMVASGNVTHMLFVGPAGTGKTTCALAMAREIFGDGWSSSFIEVNASDDSRISFVREVVKEYARTAPADGAPFKILFLDEADNLSRDSQDALRVIMEKYHSNCRIIMSCNYASKIMPPLQSRCCKLSFRPVDASDLRPYLERIAAEESVEVDPEAMSELVRIADGDVRRAVNSLQSAAASGDAVGREEVYRATGTADPAEVRDIVATACAKDFKGARAKMDGVMSRYSLAGTDMLRLMLSEIEGMEMNERKRAGILVKLAEIEFRMVEGCSDRLQLDTFLADLTILDP